MNYIFTQQPDGRYLLTTSEAPPTVPPVVVPFPPPVAPPPPSTPAGAWPLQSTQLWPVPPLRGSVISVPFVADVAQYPNGFLLQGVDESNGPAKDYVVSTSQGSFVPLNANAEQLGAGNVMGPIYMRCGPARPRIWFGLPLPSLDVPTTPGKTYWINVRASDGSGAVVNTQFVCYARTDN